MTGQGRTILVSLLLVFLSQPPAAATTTFAGKSLTEALQELQSDGLEIVFTSNVVRPEMIVTTEPRSADPRRILDELLAPHGLVAQPRADGILVVVVAIQWEYDRRSAISGVVRSRHGAIPLSGTTVRLRPGGIEAVSDVEGSFYFDDLAPGSFIIEAVLEGFVVERLELELHPGATTEVSFWMNPAPITTETLVVTPSKTSLLRDQPAGFFALDADELQALPHLANDFFRALSLLPGVTSNDVTAQFYVRGGRRDETQILLDGQELFDSYHLQDFDYALSAVVPETISRVDLSTGGFPVEYGDRMSGVLDMASATPSGAPRGRVALGVLSAQAGGTGSFDRQRGGWIAQLRRGTTDFAGRIFGTDAPRFWDAFGKLEYEIRPRQRLRLDLLHTDDEYVIEELVDGDFKSFDTNYRSSYAWLTHQAIVGASTYLESAVSISRTDRDRNGLEIEEDFQFVVSDLRDMAVRGLRFAANHQLGPAHGLRGGFELRDFDTEFDYFRSHQADGVGGRRVDQDLRESHLGLYAADSWLLTAPFQIELGLRYDLYSLTSEGLLSPRLNLLYALGDHGVVRFAAGQFNQSQRPYELQVEDGEAGFYPVERSEHWIAGYEHRLASGTRAADLSLRIEVYYRNVGNPRPRYENLYEPLNTFPEVEPDRLRIGPERSRAQGLELFLRGRVGRQIGWWFNYVWATTEDQLDGQWVPRRFDQPHSFNFDLDYCFGRSWRLNVAARIHTGWPVTPIAIDELEGEGGTMEASPGFGQLNSERFPTYRRLDLRLSRIWGLRFGALTFYLDIQNLFDQKNASGLDIVWDEDEGTLTVNHEYWVGFFPSAGIILDLWGGPTR